MSMPTPSQMADRAEAFRETCDLALDVIARARRALGGQAAMDGPVWQDLRDTWGQATRNWYEAHRFVDLPPFFVVRTA